VGLVAQPLRMTASTTLPTKVTGTGGNVGGAVGNFTAASRSTLEGIQVGVITPVSSPTISAATGAGGLIGNGNKVDVTKCDTTANITATGNNVGGLVGNAADSLFSVSNARGTVKGADNTGGFAGVTGSNIVGGFVGNLASDMITNSAAKGTVAGTTAVGTFAGQNYKAGENQKPTVPGDGSYVLKYFTRDGAGNQSETGIRSFKVDTTPPETPAVKMDGTDYAGAIAGTVDVSTSIMDTAPVSVTAKDGQSGIDQIGYKAVSAPQGGAYAPQSDLKIVSGSTANFTVNPAFEGYVYTKATDEAGNSSETYTKGFTMNTTKYITTAAATPSPALKNGWTTGNVSFALGCTQGGSPVQLGQM
ncbi:MAG: hypothetical protein RR614_01540, partial [Eubacterium sp.]